MWEIALQRALCIYATYSYLIVWRFNSIISTFPKQDTTVVVRIPLYTPVYPYVPYTLYTPYISYIPRIPCSVVHVVYYYPVMYVPYLITLHY